MKRLVPLLILGVFCLGILGARAFHLHHQLQKSASTHHGNFPILLAFDESSDALDETEHPLTPSGDLAFFPEPCYQNLPTWDLSNPTSQEHDNRQGLGCGGLPA
ncbi:MAG: hypothetical protein WCD80_03445 [Desulfobaccales bacterium]